MSAAAALDHDADATRRRAWCQVRNLLVVRLDNLGDVLMATPAIAALRAGLPDARCADLGEAARYILSRSTIEAVS